MDRYSFILFGLVSTWSVIWIMYFYKMLIGDGFVMTLIVMLLSLFSIIVFQILEEYKGWKVPDRITSHTAYKLVNLFWIPIGITSIPLISILCRNIKINKKVTKGLLFILIPLAILTSLPFICWLILECFMMLAWLVLP